MHLIPWTSHKHKFGKWAAGHTPYPQNNKIVQGVAALCRLIPTQSLTFPRANDLKNQQLEFLHANHCYFK